MDVTDPTASNGIQTIIPGGPVPAPDVTVITDEADNCSVPVVAFVSTIEEVVAELGSIITMGKSVESSLPTINSSPITKVIDKDNKIIIKINFFIV